MATKSETLGERIKRIRGETTYQADFGRRLGVSQGTVSAWERDDKDRLPSADVYCRLAALASDPADALFFLREAGLSVETIVAATNKLAADRIVRPSKGDNVLIASTESNLPDIELPSSRIPDPLLTRYFKVEKHLMEPAAFEPGEIFLLDISNAAAGALEPFWDKLILVEVDFDDPTLRATAQHGKRIVAGWLVLSHYYSASSHGVLAVAELHPWIGASHKPGGDFDLSTSPRSPMEGGSSRSRHLNPFMIGEEHAVGIDLRAQRAAKSYDEFARGHLRAGAHIRILGRIIGWLPSPTRAGA